MLEAITSDVTDNYGNGFQTNLVLDDVVKNNPTEATEAVIGWRHADEPTAIPQPLAKATIGVVGSTPFDFSDGREIELFVIAKTATGEQSAVNFLDGLTQRFLPNLETNTPALALTVGFTVTNVLARLTVSNFTTKALHRRIKVSENSDMSGATATEQHASDYNGLLPDTIDITKPSSGGAEHRYVTVEHSSNDIDWGTASDIFDILFADSGGSGGGSPETKAVFTVASWDEIDTVSLEWSAASGSGNYTVQSRYRLLLGHWSSWSSWTSLTTTESGLSYSDTQTADSWDKQVQYRVKRTTQSDLYYSDVATIEMPAV